MYRDEGLKGFFKGNGTNILKVVPETALKMLTYDRIKELVCRNPQNPSVSDRYFAGAVAGLFSQFLIYPLDFIKTKLALSEHLEYKGIVDVAKTVYRREGVKGFYRGVSASLIGVVPYSSLDLGTFNTLKDLYIRYYSDAPSAFTLLYCGMISGIFSQTCTYPFNLVRTRLQNQEPGDEMFKGMRDCFRKTVKKEGFKGLYRGLLSNYVRSVPAVAISYTVFEKSKSFLAGMFV